MAVVLSSNLEMFFDYQSLQAQGASSIFCKTIGIVRVFPQNIWIIMT